MTISFKKNWFIIVFPLWAILMVYVQFKTQKDITQIEYLAETAEPCFRPYGPGAGYGYVGGYAGGGYPGTQMAMAVLKHEASVESINCEQQERALKQVLKSCNESNHNSKKSSTNCEASYKQIKILEAKVALQTFQLTKSASETKDTNIKLNGLLKENKSKNSTSFIVQILISLLGSLFVLIKYVYLKKENEDKASVYSEMFFNYTATSLIPLLNLIS